MRVKRLDQHFWGKKIDALRHPEPLPKFRLFTTLIATCICSILHAQLPLQETIRFTNGQWFDGTRFVRHESERYTSESHTNPPLGEAWIRSLCLSS
jgi:hypothetical protein